MFISCHAVAKRRPLTAKGGTVAEGKHHAPNCPATQLGSALHDPRDASARRCGMTCINLIRLVLDEDRGQAPVGTWSRQEGLLAYDARLAAIAHHRNLDQPGNGRP
jgi:hypothetical protein